MWARIDDKYVWVKPPGRKKQICGLSQVMDTFGMGTQESSDVSNAEKSFLRKAEAESPTPKSSIVPSDVKTSASNDPTKVRSTG